MALSEDNGLAVVTRMMIDESGLFKADKPDPDRLISFAPNVNILEINDNAVTSVLGLFQVVKALYPRGKAKDRPEFTKSWPSFTVVQHARPRALDDIYEYNVRYWKTLIDTVAEYKTIFEGDGKKKSNMYRKPTTNHLLFRPVGQLAFARATQFAVHSGRPLEDAVTELYEGITPKLTDPSWHHILWDPLGKRMLSGVTLAEAHLLQSAGLTVRSAKVAAKLREIQENQIQG